MKIGNIDLDREVLVIAEIGNNHEGKFSEAERFLEAAARTGVQAVKFQTFRTEAFVSKADEARFNRFKKFELSFSQFESLKRRADSLGVMFLSTPFDLESARFLNQLVPAFKIGSAELSFYPLLQEVAGFGKPIILSTGFSELSQIDFSKAFIERAWRRISSPAELALLHCVSSYPTPPNEANLAAIRVLAEKFKCTVGYSDHTLGIEAAFLSVALGARIIEKHFTVDKNYSDFRDHQVSADEADMKALVEGVKRASVLVGSSVKEIQPSTRVAIPLVDRSTIAIRDLPAGHILQLSDLAWARPGGGVAPGDEVLLIGKATRAAIAQGAQITQSSLA